MWGTLPFGSSLLAILVVLIPESKRREEAGRVPGHAMKPFCREVGLVNKGRLLASVLGQRPWFSW